MIRINNLSKKFGTKILFENTNLVVHEGDKIAIIGQNGTGKSTFFKCLTGEEEYEQGTIEMPQNFIVSSMEQENNFEVSEDNFFDHIKKRKETIKKEIKKIEAKLSDQEIYDDEIKFQKVISDLEIKNNSLKEDLEINKIRKMLKELDFGKEEARHLVKKGNVSFGLRKFGPKIVCVTDGKRGSEICDGHHIYKSYPNKVKIAEKTGAGDAFASGFVAGLILYEDIEHAIEAGSLNAESVIQKPGAKNGLLTREELESKMKGRWKVRVSRKRC